MTVTGNYRGLTIPCAGIAPVHGISPKTRMEEFGRQCLRRQIHHARLGAATTSRRSSTHRFRRGCMLS